MNPPRVCVSLSNFRSVEVQGDEHEFIQESMIIEDNAFAVVEINVALTLC
jgi:hypothetical protein